MTRFTSSIRVAIAVLAVVILGGLLGWYYFLHRQNEQTALVNAAAGYDQPAPTFEGSAGSTYANTASTLGAGVNAASSTSRLWEVSQVPVAGFGWQGGNTGILDFVERSSGYVLQAEASNRSVTRITDTLRPKTYEASITLDGSVLERSIDDSGTLITFAGEASSTSDDATSTDLVGSDLSDGIQEIAADPQYDTLFYGVAGPGGTTFVSTNWSGQKEKQLFSSPLSQWRLLAPGDGTVVLLQAPLDGVVGYAYQIGKTGSLSLIAQAPGLTVLPDASSTALIFGVSSGGLSLYSQANAGVSPERLSVQTVADKCAWVPGPGLLALCAAPEAVPSQQFLDDWYKGIVHTADKFYEIDVTSASTTLLYDPTGDTSAQLDVEDPQVDPTGQYLAFINARDLSLWVLRIAQ